MLGIRQPNQEPTRQIYLADGRKVSAPSKPEKICISYSIIPESHLNYYSWLQYIHLDSYKNTDEVKTIRKFYL